MTVKMAEITTACWIVKMAGLIADCWDDGVAMTRADEKTGVVM